MLDPLDTAAKQQLARRVRHRPIMFHESFLSISARASAKQTASGVERGRNRPQKLQLSHPAQKTTHQNSSSVASTASAWLWTAITAAAATSASRSRRGAARRAMLLER